MSVWVEIMRILQQQFEQLVTLHVSVWVEIPFTHNNTIRPMSRSTWACELKYSVILKKHIPMRSHAPRERVSWNAYDLAKGKFEESVTLHVSVWVEIHNTVCVHNRRGVTLHVSVWVEITNTLLEHIHITVTLHVSVWVEIVFNCDFKLVYYRHAPRERVSWNASSLIVQNASIRHAPRERVSWNI